jgi:hypothetical protein
MEFNEGVLGVSSYNEEKESNTTRNVSVFDETLLKRASNHVTRTYKRHKPWNKTHGL